MEFKLTRQQGQQPYYDQRKQGQHPRYNQRKWKNKKNEFPREPFWFLRKGVNKTPKFFITWEQLTREKKYKPSDLVSRQFKGKEMDKRIALSRFASGLSMYKHQGLYIWALLERANQGDIFLERYAPQRQMHVIEQYYRTAKLLKNQYNKFTNRGAKKRYKAIGRVLSFNKYRSPRILLLPNRRIVDPEPRNQELEEWEIAITRGFTLSAVKSRWSRWRSVALEQIRGHRRSYRYKRIFDKFADKPLQRVTVSKVFRAERMWAHQTAKNSWKRKQKRLRWIRWFRKMSWFYNQWPNKNEVAFYPFLYKKAVIWAVIKRLGSRRYKSHVWLKIKQQQCLSVQPQRITRLKPLVNKATYKSPLGGALVDKGTKNFLFDFKAQASAPEYNTYFNVHSSPGMIFNNIALGLYSQYLYNLQMTARTAVALELGSENYNSKAAKALRKYVQLLVKYYEAVHDRKVAKKIPASTALKWARVYLKLAGHEHRRPYMSTRYRRVAYKFKPQEKWKGRAVREKTMLHGAKIIFDRLFKWLYNYTNVRYALAQPIQKGAVQNYLLRNSFIYKKSFKVRFAEFTKC